MNTDWNDLIQRHIAGLITDEEAQRLATALRADEALADLYVRHIGLEVALEANAASAEVTRELLSVPATIRPRPWLSWRSLIAAAAGIVFGMFCTSVVFAYTQAKSPVAVTRLLQLADADFESGPQIPAQGIPARAGVWSGDFSCAAVAENGITPRQGQRMLRLLRSDNELSPPNERSYVGEAAQVIDLRPLRGELSGVDQLLEVSAQFNAIPAPPGLKYEFNVKAAAFRGDIADAPRLWEDHEASVSRSSHSMLADSEVATWQRVAVPLVVPSDADFLIIEGAVVFREAQVEHGAVEFPGHYVDQVEVRLTETRHAD
jgi:hypothetical protein